MFKDNPGSQPRVCGVLGRHGNNHAAAAAAALTAAAGTYATPAPVVTAAFPLIPAQDLHRCQF